MPTNVTMGGMCLDYTDGCKILVSFSHRRYIAGIMKMVMGTTPQSMV
jgi:hypothetical protein